MNAITIGAKYTLDGVLLQCVSMNEKGLGWFQEINADGSPKMEYHKNSEGENIRIKDWGRRIVCKRIPELRPL